MKTRPWFWTFIYVIAVVLIFVMIAIAFPAKANGITVCRDTSVEWFRYRFSGIDWSLDTLHYVADGASADGNTLIADALREDNGDGIVFKDEALIGYHIGEGNYFMLKGSPETTPCGEGHDPDVWHPGAPSIYIPMTSDCAFVEIQDDYGNWSLVTSDGEPVLLHYGQALIGSTTQPTDPARYWAIETECPG